MTELKYRVFGSFLLLAGLIAANALAAERRCAVCGAFYPAEIKELSAELDGYFGKASTAPLPGEVRVLVAPHAGYEFSAQIAADGYAKIAPDYDTVVIIGTAHTMRVKNSALTKDDYATPLGAVKTDAALVERLLKDKNLFSLLPAAHAKEHSIEVQLPFLQKKLKDPFKIVPIVMNTADERLAEDIGKALAKALKGRKALIIISTDLSHYPDKPAAEITDKTALRALETLDPHYFWLANRLLLSKDAEKLNLTCTFCGEAAAIAGIAAANELGANRAELIRYANSSDSPRGTADRVVGYAAMALIKAKEPKPAGITLSDKQKKELLSLARKAITSHFDKKPLPSGLSPEIEFNLPAAVFVTLTENGGLRGCIGTTEPQAPLADSVAYFARAAAFNDTRFRPVESDEVYKLHIEVSILSRPQPVASAKEIMPGKHGVTVASGGRHGLFLPQVWEHFKDDKDGFLSELCAQKAGLPRDCWKDAKTRLSVFTVYSFEEKK